MVKEYVMTGACPIVVGGYGRIEPGAPPFACEMEAEQEKFFVKIGAVRIVQELPGAAPTTPPPELVDGALEFEGRELKTWPTSWPRRPEPEEEPAS